MVIRTPLIDGALCQEEKFERKAFGDRMDKVHLSRTTYFSIFLFLLLVFFCLF